MGLILVVKLYLGVHTFWPLTYLETKYFKNFVQPKLLLLIKKLRSANLYVSRSLMLANKECYNEDFLPIPKERLDELQIPQGMQVMARTDKHTHKKKTSRFINSTDRGAG